MSHNSANSNGETSPNGDARLNSSNEENAEVSVNNHISNDFDVESLPDDQKRVIAKVVGNKPKFWFAKVLNGAYKDAVVFIYYTNLRTEGYKQLYKHETVEFDLIVNDKNEKKYIGINVSGVGNSKLNVELIYEDNLKYSSTHQNYGNHHHHNSSNHSNYSNVQMKNNHNNSQRGGRIIHNPRNPDNRGGYQGNREYQGNSRYQGNRGYQGNKPNFNRTHNSPTQ